jgi:hypothetical protein
MVILLPKNGGRALYLLQRYGEVKYFLLYFQESHLHNSQAKGKHPVQPLNTANSLNCTTAQLQTHIPLT